MYSVGTKVIIDGNENGTIVGGPFNDGGIDFYSVKTETDQRNVGADRIEARHASTDYSPAFEPGDLVKIIDNDEGYRTGLAMVKGERQTGNGYLDECDCDEYAEYGDCDCDRDSMDEGRYYYKVQIGKDKIDVYEDCLELVRKGNPNAESLAEEPVMGNKPRPAQVHILREDEELGIDAGLAEEAADAMMEIGAKDAEDNGELTKEGADDAVAVAAEILGVDVPEVTEPDYEDREGFQDKPAPRTTQRVTGSSASCTYESVYLSKKDRQILKLALSCLQKRIVKLNELL